MPKRKIVRGSHPRRLGPRARSHQRAEREQIREVFGHCGVNTPATTDPYAPQFGETVVLATEARCASCPTEIAEGAEATYIDGELNCSECTWEARQCDA